VEAPARPASEHRDGADVAGLQLAGHRLGGAQGHQPRLLHRTGPATEVEREAGLTEGLAGARIDVHDHLADGAAEGSGGGHGEKARNTGSNAPPLRTGQGRAPGCGSRQPLPGTRRLGQCSSGARLFMPCSDPSCLRVDPCWGLLPQGAPCVHGLLRRSQGSGSMEPACLLLGTAWR
jgi:hypothetical protein